MVGGVDHPWLVGWTIHGRWGGLSMVSGADHPWSVGWTIVGQMGQMGLVGRGNSRSEPPEKEGEPPEMRVICDRDVA